MIDQYSLDFDLVNGLEKFELEFLVEDREVAKKVLDSVDTTELQFTAGFTGPPGPAGPSGVTGAIYTFNSPLTLWTITHNLGRRPSVEVYSIGGLNIFASILHLNNDIVEISFDAAQSGFAIIT